jgi:hypothetical protein
MGQKKEGENSQRATEGRDDGHEVDIVDGGQLHLARLRGGPCNVLQSSCDGIVMVSEYRLRWWKSLGSGRKRRAEGNQ